jgi:hypothetical protein
LDRLRKDLRASTAEGTATSVMVGVGETYLPAFVLALSGSQVACGLISTVPLLMGAVLQLVTPCMVQWCQSYRRWVVFTATVQAAAFVPLAAAGIVGAMPLTLVFLSAALYWGAGMASGAPWNAWMETLVPERLRARYFARRTLIGQWGVSAGFVVGGVTLQAASGGNGHLWAFGLLFLAAAGSRLLSSCLLARQSEPQPPPRGSDRPAPCGLWDALGEATKGPVLVYLLATQMAVQVAGPYFNPYMLGHLEFSYSAYVVVICTSAVAKILFLPAVGRIVDQWGVQRVFWISGLAVVPLPALWIISSAFPYLLAVQVFSGVAWGAYDLATLLLFFQTIPRQRRVQVLSVFNVANAAATVAGSVIGGGVLSAFGASRSAYLAVFAVSTLARAAALVLLARKPQTAAGRAERVPHGVPAGAMVVVSLSSQFPRGPHRRRAATARAGHAVEAAAKVQERAPEEFVTMTRQSRP